MLLLLLFFISTPSINSDPNFSFYRGYNSLFQRVLSYITTWKSRETRRWRKFFDEGKRFLSQRRGMGASNEEGSVFFCFSFVIYWGFGRLEIFRMRVAVAAAAGAERQEGNIFFFFFLLLRYGWVKKRKYTILSKKRKKNCMICLSMGSINRKVTFKFYFHPFQHRQPDPKLTKL